MKAGAQNRSRRSPRNGDARLCSHPAGTVLRRRKGRLRSGLLRAMLLLFGWMELSLIDMAAQQANGGTASTISLSGVVVDAKNEPVGDAVVKLRGKSVAEGSTRTGKDGIFKFVALRRETYTLTAQAAGAQSGPVTADLHGSNPASVRLVLTPGETPSSTQALEFSDRPDFTIAGITDWTAVGGHGSDVTLRTSEEVTRETVSLTDKSKGTGSLDATAASRRDRQETDLVRTLAADPRSYAANHALGQFYLGSGQFAKSIKPLETAATLHGDAPEDEYTVALALQGTNDLAQAEQHVTQAMARGDAAKYHLLAGELDESLGNPLDAVEQDQRATQLDPSEGNYFAWGSELLLHRAVWQAAEVFSRGSQLHPTSQRLKTGWGAALFAGARYAEAARHLCEASDLDPANRDSYLVMGKVMLVSSTPLSCIEQRLDRFLGANASDADANYLDAMRWLKTGNHADAEHATELLRRAVALRPDFAAACLQLGGLASARRENAEAAEFYKQAIRADPGEAEAYYRLSVLYDRSGNTAAAQHEMQIHERLAKTQADAVEQQRREVKQFVVTLPGAIPDSSTP